MSPINFTAILNLSNFFNDHRHKARIFIDKNIKTVKDLQSKITNIFNITNFVLICQNEFLPPSEDIRILHSDDIIWVIPSNFSSDFEYEQVQTEICSDNKLYPSNDSTETSQRKMKAKKKYTSKLPINSEIEQPSRKKKKKQFVEIEAEEVKIPKKRKNKYKDSNSKDAKEAFSEGNKFPMTKTQDLSHLYIEPYINISTYQPYNISHKKNTPIPTITDEYLKEKKVNIIKIDNVSKPTNNTNQEEEWSDNKLTGTLQKIANPTNLLDEKEFMQVTNSEPVSCASDKQILNHTTSEILNAGKNDDQNYLEQENEKSSLVPSTKYFFLNTPSSLDKKKKVEATVKGKRENFFKLNNFPASPLCKKDSGYLKTGDNFTKHFLKEFNQLNEKHSFVDLFKYVPPIRTMASVSQNDLNDKESLNENVNAIDDRLCSITPNIHNQQTIEETKTDITTTPNKIEPISTELEIDTQFKNVETPNRTVEVHDAKNVQVFGELSTAVLQDSFYLDKISPCIATDDLESFEHENRNLRISTAKSNSCWGKTQKVSGVGDFLKMIRNSESSGILDTSTNDVSGPFVRKRKRHRTRTRKKTIEKSPKETITIKDNTPVTVRSLSIATTPKVHIKFSDNEDATEGESDEKTTNEKEINISIECQRQDVQFLK